MTMKKKLCCLIAGLMLISFSASPVYATGEVIRTYETEKADKEITEKGQTYVLQGVEANEIEEEPESKQTVSKEVVFAEGEAVPAEYSFTAKDEATGETVTVKGALKDKKTQSSGTEKQTLPLKVYTYDADTYTYLGIELPHSDERPDLAGKEAQVVKASGLDPSVWQVTGTAWNGAAHDENGVLVREGSIFVARETITTKALYEGTINHERKTKTEYVATYIKATPTPTVTPEPTATPSPTVTPTPTPVPKSSPSPVLIGAGIAVLAAAIIAVIAVVAKKKKK